MPTYLTPGVFLEEVPGGPRPIEAVGTSLAAFVGAAPDPTVRPGEPVPVTNWTRFTSLFMPPGSASNPLSNAVYGFFLNGGSFCYVVNTGTDVPLVRALDALAAIDEIAIVCVPGATDAASYDAALSHCERLGDRVALLDGPPKVEDVTQLTEQIAAVSAEKPKKESGEAGADKPKTESGEAGAEKAPSPPGAGAQPQGASGPARPRDSIFGAVYYPWLTVKDPVSGLMVDVPPSGHVAGIWARTDGTRGVHKAPANETVRGALDLTHRLTDAEQSILNPAGVNAIRFFTREGGIRVWGARTLADSSSEWRYLNVRRLLNMIEESIVEGTRWCVFEPNDQTLWNSISRDVSAFLRRMWRDGALVGRTADEAFFVKCDEETNPPDVVAAGQVVTVIGVAPVKPAEFIVFRISQFEGGVETETQGSTNA